MMNTAGYTYQLRKRMMIQTDRGRPAVAKIAFNGLKNLSKGLGK
jgi:hypothetical protein